MNQSSSELMSKRLERLPKADIRGMSLRCAEIEGINLSQGVCDLPSPEILLKRTAEAIRADKSAYAPARGIPELREAMAEKLKSFNGITADPEKEILVSSGVTGSYASVLMGLLNPGDGILLFEPYYAYHYNQALLAGVEPKLVDLAAPDFQITKEKLEEHYDPSLKAVLLCTPSNPSGRMYSEKEIRIVGDFAKEKSLLMITDEIYEYFTYENRSHVSAASLPEYKDHCVTMMGLSKTFSITGWRLGYVVASEKYMTALTKAHDLLYVCPPTPLQHGMVAGFREVGQSYFDELRKDFQSKRDRICRALKEAKLEPIVPQGSYYVLADISQSGEKDSFEAAMKILNEKKVASVPGQAFFQSANKDRYVRFCFAVEDQLLDQACEKLTQ